MLQCSRTPATLFTMDNLHFFTDGEIVFKNSELTPDDKSYYRMLRKTCERMLRYGYKPEEEPIMIVVQDTMQEASDRDLDRSQAHGVAQMNVMGWNMSGVGEPLVGKNADLVLAMVDHLFSRDQLN